MAEAAEFLKRTGVVIEVEEPRLIGKDPKFQKQVGRFTVETSREWKEKTYHDYLNFDCEGKAMSSYPKVGDNVDVEFTIGGNKWKGKDGSTKYFTKLKAYKITTNFSSGGGAQPQKQAYTPNNDDLSFLNDNQPDGDDLPF